MSRIIQEIAIPALREMGLEFFKTADEEGLVIPVPAAGSPSSVHLVFLHPQDEADQCLLACELFTVPRSSRSRVAVTTAEMNTRWNAVVFSMKAASLRADIFVELAYCSDPRAMFGLSLVRLARAVFEALPLLQRVVDSKGREAKVLREAEQVLKDADV